MSLFNRLFNRNFTITTTTTTTTPTSVQIGKISRTLFIPNEPRSTLIRNVSSSITFFKLPIILNSLNEKTRQIFNNFKLYFVVIIVVLVVLIFSTMILIILNFLKCGSGGGDGPNGDKKKKRLKSTKKKTLSFDIIDNGYKQNRIQASSSSAFRFFTRSSSAQSNLVVDHDNFQFEDFTNLNRTFDRLNTSNNNNESSPSVDNFYELPYIDASTTEFNNNSKQPQKQCSISSNNESLAVLASVSGKGASSVLSRQDSLKFKTFSARKFENLKRNSQLLVANGDCC